MWGRKEKILIIFHDMKHLIVVGEGSTQAVLEVLEVPQDGEVLEITNYMLKYGISENCRLLIGDRFKFSRNGNLPVTRKEGNNLIELGELPWFGITNTKYL